MPQQFIEDAMECSVRPCGVVLLARFIRSNGELVRLEPFVHLNDRSEFRNSQLSARYRHIYRSR